MVSVTDPYGRILGFLDRSRYVSIIMVNVRNIESLTQFSDRCAPWKIANGVENFCFKFKLYCDRRSVGKSDLVSGTHLGPMTNFSFSLKFSLDSCRFVIL
jgi:hypothetical protein